MNITATLMLKAPRPGTVKTRLAREIGIDKATFIYRSLAEKQLTQVPKDWRCAIHFAPPGAVEEVREWLAEVVPADILYRPQCDGDLGARMRHAVQTELSAGADAVVLLGGDCPDIDTQLLREVETKLSAADLVVAPALDGGYVLLAVKADHPELFDGIAWSTSEVWPQTLAAARQCGLGVSILRTCRDVDDLQSLRDSLKELAACRRGFDVTGCDPLYAKTAMWIP